MRLKRQSPYAEIGGGAGVRGIALQAGRSRVRFPKGSVGFFTDLILPAALLPEMKATDA